jgi:hypothetical protein
MWGNIEWGKAPPANLCTAEPYCPPGRRLLHKLGGGAYVRTLPNDTFLVKGGHTYLRGDTLR